MTATSKTPVTFIWKPPTNWRQFIDTGVIASLINKNDLLKVFFQQIVKYAGRCPSNIFGAMPAWWRIDMPTTPAVAGVPQIVPIKPIVEFQFFGGFTFRGRDVMGQRKTAVSVTTNSIVVD